MFDTVTVNNGKYIVDVLKDDAYIGPRISTGGEWDGWMRGDIQNYYKPGTDILDIGGNIGYNALMFSDYGPVHTFEPLFHSILLKNVNQNTLKNTVKVHPYGLGSKYEEAKIYVPKVIDEKFINWGGCSMNPYEVHSDVFHLVEVKPLNAVYHGVPSIIKVDIEGHELEFLKGAHNVLSCYRPTLMLEIHDFQMDNPIVRLLLKYGYTTISPRPQSIFLFT